MAILENEITDNYTGLIKEYMDLFIKFKKGAKIKSGDKYIVCDINNNEAVLRLLEALSKMYYAQIHNYLIPMENESCEKRIRAYIKDIISTIIPVLEAKVSYLSRMLGRNTMNKPERQAEANDLRNTLHRYIVLVDDFYALAAFRSLKYFALYSEFDKIDSQKLWRYVMPNFEGYFYYANALVIDGTIKRISKSFPTGYGKSYSDLITIAFIFGYDINNDVMKVVGNNKLITDVYTGLVRIMTSKWYAKVFPYYRQFECDANKMFSTQKANDGIFTIEGSNRPKSFLCFAKDTAVDGGRFKYRFYDDITRSKDAGRVEQHLRDYEELYTKDWKRREYDQYNSYEIVSGTRYHIEDFISRFCENYGGDNAKKVARFRYCEINEDTRLVIIKVPKLDPITDESTFPERYPTHVAREERSKDPRTFSAMEQQCPESPKECPYHWDNIKTYEVLPAKENEGGRREDFCRASLDLPRTGANNISLGIYSKCGDYYYLVDAYYNNRPLNFQPTLDSPTELDNVCDMIIRHKVRELAVEVNTCSDIKTQIMEKLAKKGYMGCKVDEIYSTENKEAKIFQCQNEIINYIVFPCRKVFPISSMVGRFMFDLTGWNPKAKIDDSIDSVCMFVQTYLQSKANNYGVVTTFRR